MNTQKHTKLFKHINTYTKFKHIHITYINNYSIYTHTCIHTTHNDTSHNTWHFTHNRITCTQLDTCNRKHTHTHQHTHTHTHTHTHAHAHTHAHTHIHTHTAHKKQSSILPTWIKQDTHTSCQLSIALAIYVQIGCISQHAQRESGSEASLILHLIIFLQVEHCSIESEPHQMDHLLHSINNTA